MTKSRIDSHEEFHRDEEFKYSSNRSFGLTFAAVFFILAAVSWWKNHHLWPYLGPIGAVFLAVSLTIPAALAWPNRQWARFGLLLHRIVNPLVMGFLFYLVVTPIGLAARLAGKDFLRLKRDASASYWIDRTPPGPSPDSMRNQY